MATSNPFKSYARGSRNQLGEKLFAAGMKWTQSPLPEGQSRLLVNFDVRGSGSVIVPRAGLRHGKTFGQDAGMPVWNNTLFLAGAKACAEADGVHAQVLLSKPSAADAGTGLTAGGLWGVTAQNEATTKTVDLAPAPGHALLKQVPAEGIHGMARTGKNVYRLVGTFGYGNQFFYFRKNAGGTYELATTRYDATTDLRYEPEVVTPKALSPKEAVLWGYNMLLSAPYTFTNSVGVGLIQLLGVLPYDASGNLQLTPVQNQTLKLVCTYACPAGTTHRVVWEWKDVSGTSWTVLKDGNVSTGSLAEMSCTFSSPVAAAMIRVTVYNGAATTPDQVMAVGFNFTKQGNMANAAQKTYTLASCEGMTYWKNQLVVWAPKEDRTMLFVSDVNAPHYFPYPNKAEPLDEPVIHAMPLLDSLLVFTTTTLVQLTMSADGLGWNKKTIQRNLNISAGDLHLLQPVKNMVFFKSGNYYYMVVPSTKSLGDLVVAPVSANIIELLDDFSNGVGQILEAAYDYTGAIALRHYYNFLDFEDIHNIYMLELDDGVLLNFDLVYNSVGRYWRIYLFESVRQVVPYRQDVTRSGTYMSLAQDNDLPQLFTCGFDKLQPEDIMLPDGGPTDITAAWRKYRTFRNWQVWDTGSREHNSDFKKRYREIQLKLNNISQEQLYFHHEFTIDGERRRGMYSYHTEHNVTPGDDYGTLTVVRELIDPSIVPGVTVLADQDDPNSDGWELDASLFPEMNLWKIRLPVSGKGYAPKLLLVSRNEALFEMMNVNWVFRDMYSR